MEGAPVVFFVAAAGGEAAPGKGVCFLAPGAGGCDSRESRVSFVVHGSWEQDLGVDGQLAAAEEWEELVVGLDADWFDEESVQPLEVGLVADGSGERGVGDITLVEMREHILG